MAVNQNITKTCRKCGLTTDDFRLQHHVCRPCGRLQKLEWAKRHSPNEAIRLEREFFERQQRKEYLTVNPLLKWCENGSHFVERIRFSKGSNDDGLQSKCKGCVSQKRQENLTAIKAQKKIYCEQNKEKIRAGYLDWYHNRCDKKRHYKQTCEWREKNSARYKQRNRESYLTNIEPRKEAARARYRTHKHLWSVYAENRIARKKSASGSFTAEQWQAKCAYFGFCCYLCHVSLINQEVHIEHRIPLSRGGTSWIANIAPACRQCNLRKHTKTEREFRQHLQIAPF